VVDIDLALIRMLVNRVESLFDPIHTSPERDKEVRQRIFEANDLVRDELMKRGF
jgi:hypothetical protein